MKVVKRLSAVCLACALALAMSLPAFAAEVPEGASVAGMSSVEVSKPLSQDELSEITQQLQEQQAAGITPYNTVTGDAGSSWINLSYVSPLRSQSSFGCSCTKRMIELNYALAYVGAGDGSHSGVALPMSKEWSGEYVKDHSKSGGCTVTLTASAFTTDMSLVYTLMPTAHAYIR